MWSYQVPPSPEELFHHGVKGMKWGVRRDRSTTGSGGSPRGSSTPGKSGHHESDADSDKRLMSRIKNEDDTDGWSGLMKEINTKSGDWYDSKGVSEAFKKALSDHKTMRNEIEQKYDDRSLLRKAFDRKMEVLNESHPEGSPSDADSFKKAFEKALSDPTYQEIYSKAKSMQEKKSVEMRELNKRYRERLSGVVLKDLGYKNTAKGRQFLLDQGVIFTD